MTPVFELSGAGVRYGAGRALHRVDLVVHAGERVAVIGPSGAGKSTLIGLLNGTVAPTEGRVRVLGYNTAALSRRRLRTVQRRVGTVHQRFDLVEQLRVVHNVTAGRLGSWPLWKAALSLVAPRELDAARTALGRVGIADAIDRRTGTLSGGEQQRVALARVLMQRPDAILADEPIASLDPARSAEILTLLHDACTSDGVTLLASLHDVEAALRGFDRVVGLREGGLVFDTVPELVDPDVIDALYALERR